MGSAEGAADKVTGRVDATKPAPPKMTTTAAAAATVNSVTGRRQMLTVGAAAAAYDALVMRLSTLSCARMAAAPPLVIEPTKPVLPSAFV